MIGQNKKLMYIAKSNRLIQSKYPLTASELKFTYTIMELIQTSIQNMYSKNYNEKYDASYFVLNENDNADMETVDEKPINKINTMLDIIDKIQLDKNLSCNNKCIVERIKKKNDIVWNIKIKYSLSDFYEDFKEFNNMSRLSKDMFKTIVEQVSNKGIYLINEDSNEYTFTHWYKIKGKLDRFYDEIELTIDSDIADYIITKGFYTKLTIKVLSNLKGVYALRIYELISQWDNSKGDPEYELTYLKKALNVNENKGYENIHLFKKFILDKGISEINDKVDTKYSYQEIKSSRKTVGIKFLKLNKEKSNNIQDEKEILDKLVSQFDSMLTMKLSKSMYKKFYEDFNNYDVFNNYIEELKQAEKITVKYMSNLKNQNHKSINAKIYPYFKTKLMVLIKSEPDIKQISSGTSKENEEDISDKEIAATMCDEVPIKEYKNENVSTTLSTHCEYLIEEGKLTETTYLAWFVNTISEIEKIDNKLIVQVLNKFSKDVLDTRFIEIFEDVAAKCGCIDVEFKVKEL